MSNRGQVETQEAQTNVTSPVDTDYLSDVQATKMMAHEREQEQAQTARELRQEQEREMRAQAALAKDQAPTIDDLQLGPPGGAKTAAPAAVNPSAPPLATPVADTDMKTDGTSYEDLQRVCAWSSMAVLALGYAWPPWNGWVWTLLLASHAWLFLRSIGAVSGDKGPPLALAAAVTAGAALLQTGLGTEHAVHRGWGLGLCLWLLALHAAYASGF